MIRNGDRRTTEVELLTRASGGPATGQPDSVSSAWHSHPTEVRSCSNSLGSGWSFLQGIRPLCGAPPAVAVPGRRGTGTPYGAGARTGPPRIARDAGPRWGRGRSEGSGQHRTPEASAWAARSRRHQIARGLKDGHLALARRKSPGTRSALGPWPIGTTGARAVTSGHQVLRGTAGGPASSSGSSHNRKRQTRLWSRRSCGHYTRAHVAESATSNRLIPVQGPPRNQ